MRVFSFISSVIGFIITLFYLIADFPSLNSINGIIYFLLMAILLLICATGITINRPTVKHRNSRVHRIN